MTAKLSNRGQQRAGARAWTRVGAGADLAPGALQIVGRRLRDPDGVDEGGAARQPLQRRGGHQRIPEAQHEGHVREHGREVRGALGRQADQAVRGGEMAADGVEAPARAQQRVHDTLFALEVFIGLRQGGEGGPRAGGGGGGAQLSVTVSCPPTALLGPRPPPFSYPLSPVPLSRSKKTAFPRLFGSPGSP